MIKAMVPFKLTFVYHGFVASAAFITNMPIITTVGASETNTPIVLLRFIPVFRWNGHALGTIKNMFSGNTSSNPNGIG
jgi:hypothetical protein